MAIGCSFPCLLAAGAGAPLHRLRAMARVFHRELRDLLEQARDEGSVEFGNLMLTSHAIGSVVGFMYTWYKPGGPIAPDDMADEITRILMNIAGFRQRPVKRRARTGRDKEKK
jgi:hypothetical protein